MADILIVSDAASVREEIRQALGRGGNTIRMVDSGISAREALAEQAADLLVTDSQVGGMGGYAIVQDISLENGGGRGPAVPVLLLLDRRADVFLASRSGAEGWVVKPLDSIRLRRAAKALMDGGIYHDETGKPVDLIPDVATADT